MFYQFLGAFLLRAFDWKNRSPDRIESQRALWGLYYLSRGASPDKSLRVVLYGGFVLL